MPPLTMDNLLSNPSIDQAELGGSPGPSGAGILLEDGTGFILDELGNYIIQEGVPVNLVAPVTTGTGNVGETLTVDDGTWDRPPASFTYAWTSDGVPIVGAEANTFVPTSAEAETDVQPIVTAHNTAGDTDALGNAIAVAAWTPSVWSPTAWADFAFADNITPNGTDIAAIEDRIDGRVLAEVTASRQPLWDNGNTTGYWQSGLTNRLALDADNYTLPDPSTVIITFKNEAGFTNRAVMLRMGSAVLSTVFLELRADGRLHTVVDTGAGIADYDIAAIDWDRDALNTVGITIDGVNVKTYVNNVEKGGVAYAATLPFVVPQETLGNTSPTSVAIPFVGDICERLIIPSVITDYTDYLDYRDAKWSGLV